MNNILIAFEITAYGMGLVFLAILILWLMMIFLTSITTDKNTGSDKPEADFVLDDEVIARAAAIGVAMAIAEQQLSSARPLNDPPTAIISAWQLGMRTRQMTRKGEKRR